MTQIKLLFQGLKDMSISAHIGVKRMGELDSHPFHEAMKRKYSDTQADEKATELCSLWEEYLRDPEWHPIKVVNINGKHQVTEKENNSTLSPFLVCQYDLPILNRCYGRDFVRFYAFNGGG